MTSRSGCGLLHVASYTEFPRCGHPRVSDFSEVSFSVLRSSFRYLKYLNGLFVGSKSIISVHIDEDHTLPHQRHVM
jgi:hypothetical protein